MNVLGLSSVVDGVKKDSLLYPTVEKIANVL
jgi:hypothetical protein